MTELFFDEFPSPIGTLLLVCDGEALYALEYTDCGRRRYSEGNLRRRQDPNGFRTRVQAYFDGELAALHGIPVNPGGTPFQRRVWETLRSIPPGTTASYGEIAAKLGLPGAARAVGLANARNPVAIVVPCHRVVGASGKLTGYGGGLDRKRWLLAHERKWAGSTTPRFEQLAFEEIR